MPCDCCCKCADLFHHIWEAKSRSEGTMVTVSLEINTLSSREPTTPILRVLQRLLVIDTHAASDYDARFIAALDSNVRVPGAVRHC